MFAKAAVATNYRGLPLCCPHAAFLMGRAAIRPDVCPWPTAEALGELVCVVISPHPVVGVILEWFWPLIKLLAHCQVCATYLDVFLRRVCWREQVVWRMQGQSIWCMQDKVFAGLLQEGNLHSTRKTA